MNSYAALLYWMLAASPNVETSETDNTVTETASAQPRDRKPAVGSKKPEEPALSESDVAYLDAIANMPGGPLGPQQIRQLKQEHRERLREEIPNDPPSQAISTILQASLQPAALAPSITLYHGYVTSIDLVDSTGQPWPAYSPTIGDEQAVQIEGMIKTEKEDSASLVLKPGVRYANTNLVIPLRGGQRPITVLLRNDDPKPGKAVYDRITLVIDGRGPNAAPLVAQHAVGPVDDLRAVLLGTAPTKTAYRGDIAMDQTTAWIDGKTMWLRTKLALVSPAPQAELQIGDTRAYRATSLPSIVLRTETGTLETVKVTEVPSHD